MKRNPILYTFLVLYGLFSLFSIISIVAFHVSPPMWLTPLGSLVGLVFAFLHASHRRGWRDALLLAALVFVISMLFESIGVATGWPYGPYHYTNMLGPKFLGLVPYLIPIAWFNTMYPSFVIADRLFPQPGWKNALVVSALGGVIMTAWDVVMDPMMVMGGHWVWESQGPFFGIPLLNFFGWWLTTFLSFLLYLVFRSRRGETRLTFDKLAVTSYGITTLTSVIICLFGGYLGGPGLAGLFAVLPWIVLGWKASRSEPA
jgi:uncharacterized membrane protein